jgi:hypothetical protein
MIKFNSIYGFYLHFKRFERKKIKLKSRKISIELIFYTRVNIFLNKKV